MEIVDNALLTHTQSGWLSAVWSRGGLYRLCFGDATPQLSLARLDRPQDVAIPNRDHQRELRRIVDYLGGTADDFLDIVVDHRDRTEFQRRVLEACRRIPFGTTLSYGELAAEVGSPNAARAVGTAMARNRVPLLIPCHRVLAANRKIGGYSAPDGLNMKRRLLELEGALESLSG